MGERNLCRALEAARDLGRIEGSRRSGFGASEMMGANAADSIQSSSRKHPTRSTLTEIGGKIEHCRHAAQRRRCAGSRDGMPEMSICGSASGPTDFVDSLRRAAARQGSSYAIQWWRHRRTFSKSASESSLTGSADENARCVKLTNGIMRCLDKISADNLGPTAYVSQRHLKVSLPSWKAKS